MYKMYFRQHVEQDVPASEFVASNICLAKVLDRIS